MIKIKHKGSFKNTENFLKSTKKLSDIQLYILEKYAIEAIDALSLSTPKDTGKTSLSWGYQISITENKIKLTFTNSNNSGGVPVAIILQYGHGTKNGGYVEGIDYINPTLKPIFDKIAEELGKEVNK
ncbi:MAG: phage portal protein [Clostridiaceae bacterium]|nr:phage portal protein [Clostridiaceae bacterium]